MPTAICRIRKDPHYRSDAFVGGLRAAGYTVVERARASGPEDLLVIWNRKASDEPEASRWEREGGTVLVAENGYLGKDKDGIQSYALSAHGHNGSGWWPEGDGTRFAALGLTPAPFQWNAAGHILVCGQRGIGSKEMASPRGWHDDAAQRIAKVARSKPVRVRLHPGRHAAPVPLGDDLRGAWACAIWSSSSGVQALMKGIPVVYDAPHWICSGGAIRLRDIERNPQLALNTDEVARLRAFETMSWAQWFVAELASGQPFALFREIAGMRSESCA